MVEVGDALVLIADKLGIGVKEVYRILVEAQAYQGILNLISTGRGRTNSTGLLGNQR